MTPRTLVDFFRAAERSGKPDLLLWKKDGQWKPISTAEFGERVRAISAALGMLGVEPGGTVALLSENRPEWSLVDFACQCYGAVLVPIFPTMVADQAEYLLKDSGATVAFASTPDQVKKILAAQKSCPKLKHVFVFDGPAEPGARWAKDLLDEGRAAHAKDPAAFDRRADARKPEDLATLIYTSGTTGEPKGAMLTQSNFVTNVLAAADLLPFDGEAVALSFLPLAHVFERTLEYAYFHRGATIAFAESIDKLGANLLEVNPHVFGAVPRVYEKVYARVHENLEKSSAAKQKLFEAAVAVGKEVMALRAEKKTPGAILALKHMLYDRLVYRKVRARLGSRFKYAVAGGAPLAKDLAEFFWAMGIEIYEGYGLTETSPTLTINAPGAWKPGTVGRPVAGTSIRIANDGEILAKGPQVFAGYWHNDTATTEVFDDGWFRTGDVGTLDADGYLRITGRKKELIVTSAGKNVAPAPLEDRLRAGALVSQAVVIGEGRPFVSALVTLDEVAVEQWCEVNGRAGTTISELVDDAELRTEIQRVVNDANASVSRAESIRKFAVLPSDFTIESDELTPTLKVRRGIVDKSRAAVIDAIYTR